MSVEVIPCPVSLYHEVCVLIVAQLMPAAAHSAFSFELVPEPSPLDAHMMLVPFWLRL